ncbi:MAG: hypothetical protein JHC40_21995 [Burkholderiales bacterium]|jgi:hypothetical protein|nr:hypothetical protein [Burkholderiales bacterium]
MFEQLFLDITTERLRNAMFRSVPEPVTAIKEFIALQNEDPTPCQAVSVCGRRPQIADRAQ